MYEEFKELFPNNAVGYFVSYYDYYQPEAYIPQRDIYIEKDSSRNDDLDRLRLSATSNLVSRNDVLLVASVSCIFGLGSPTDYKASVLPIRMGETTDRDEMLRKLIDLQYARNDIDFKRATFRVRGDVVELHPSYEEFAYRIEMFGDEISAIDAVNPLTGEIISSEQQIFIYPAVHYVMPEERVQRRGRNPSARNWNMQVMHLRGQGKLLEAQRLLASTKYDLEMILEVGYCSGIENYSRHLDGRKPGEKPYTLIDYFPKDYLLIIDESHVTLPQIHAMYNGDQQRKQVLVDHGFRLPSALDNRPLKFEEFQKMWNQVVFVSATPGKFELEKTGGEVVEQVIRPTGLVDPEIVVHPAQGQVPHLLEQIRERAARGERVLVTALTKRLAEDLSAYIQEAGIRGRYLHSEIQTLERVEILNDLRKGEFDVLVGINLLREGLDLPEVSHGRDSRCRQGRVSSQRNFADSNHRPRRQKRQCPGDPLCRHHHPGDANGHRRNHPGVGHCRRKYNTDHGITPVTIEKAIRTGIEGEMKARRTAREAIHESESQFDQTELIRLLEEEMLEAAKNLEFERAAQLRDKLNEIKGVPTIRSANSWDPEVTESDQRTKIWQPKSKGKRKRAAK